MTALALPPTQTQAVSVVAVSLPGLRVDAWRTKSPSVPALPDLEGALTVRRRAPADIAAATPYCVKCPFPHRRPPLLLLSPQTRPPHLLFLASPSFQLETFTRVLGQAFPASAKSGCRAFSGMELSDEVANNVRIVQPSGVWAPRIPPHVLR